MKNLHGTVTQEQCVQLASQMHKHMQLLLQNYHALAAKNDSSKRSTLAECRKMINELQMRADKAQRYKGSLLSKVNIGDPSAPDARQNDATGPAASTKRKMENALALRRVTRSLTAAHAAVNHPSMFELVGSQAIDELSASFRRGCSVDERNAVMKVHMMELDAHLISTRRTIPKRQFNLSEDALLAEGVKRFGYGSDAWEKIHQSFLPDKTATAIRHRYKYLASSKAKTNPIKAMNSEVYMRRKEGWLIEEDVRIARGLIDLYDDKKRFYRISKEYLPHRTRTEIRKRWERIVNKLRRYVAEVIYPPLDERSLEYVLMVKEYLELKLNEQRAVEQANTSASTATSVHSSEREPNASQEEDSSTNKDDEDTSTRNPCRAKNLHPALFFTSWSLINPTALLKLTCRHNWPTFIEDVESSSRIEPSESLHSVSSPETSVNRSNDLEKRSPPLGPENVDSVQADALIVEPEAHHDEAVVETAEPSSQGTSVLPKETLDILLEEEEDDDSDYEHDELLSSENEDSESDFEQIELSDGDDEDDEDVDVHSVDSATDEGSDAPGLLTTGTHVLRHPLQLRNLRAQGNERMKRALEALERRMTSTDAVRQKSMQAPSSASMNLRAKRTIVPSVLVDTAANSSAVRNSAFEDSSWRFAAVDDRAQPPPQQQPAEFTDDWADGSGDDSFECDELLESSDDEHYYSDRDEQGDHSEFPNKKAKLQPCATCQLPPRSCTCSSSARMQQLLRRMKEKRSSALH